VELLVGSYPCPIVNLTTTTLRCEVPNGVGEALAVSISVGGQKVLSPYTFSFDIAGGIKVEPAFGPSYGYKPWTPLVTITSPIPSFGAVGDPVTVMFQQEGSTLPPVSLPADRMVFHNETTIQYKALPAGSPHGMSWVVYVQIGKRNTGTAKTTSNTYTFRPCQCDASPHGLCLLDGDCTCGGNFLFAQEGCGCDLPGRASPCAHGTWDVNETCGCACKQQWEPSPTPASWPTRLDPPGTCSACGVACGGTFQSSAPTEDGEDCACHFNTTDLIWIIGGVVLALLACWLLFTYCRKDQEEEVKDERKTALIYEGVSHEDEGRGDGERSTTEAYV